MPLTVKCPHCQEKVKVPEDMAGKKFSCPACKRHVSVPPPSGVMRAAGARQPEITDELALHPSGQLAEALSEKSFKRCPGCGHDLPQATVLCTSCGHNFSTGKSVKGHVINQPGRAKYYLGSALRTVFFLGIFALGVYLVYYAIYKDNLAEQLGNIGKKDTTRTDGTGNAPTPGTPAPNNSPAAAAQDKSLLVVINRRFPLVDIFSNEARVGQAAQGQTEKIVIQPLPLPGKTFKISFEVKNLPKGIQLAPEVIKAMNDGLTFTGTATEGMQIDIKGPPPDALPKSNEVLKGVLLEPTMYESATAMGKFKEFSYKGNVYKAPVAGGVLRLATEAKGTSVDVKWVDQDCIIEKGGKVLYTPVGSPFEPKQVKLATTNGKMDVAP